MHIVKHGSPEVREHLGHRYRHWPHQGSDDAIQRYIEDVLVGGADSTAWRRDVAPSIVGNHLLFRLDVERMNGLPLMIENDPSYKAFNCFGHIIGGEMHSEREVAGGQSQEDMFFESLMTMLHGSVGGGAARLMTSEARDWNSERIGIPAAYSSFPPVIEDYDGALYDAKIVETIALLVDAWDESLAAQFRAMFGPDGAVAKGRRESVAQQEEWAARNRAEIDAALSAPKLENTYDPAKVYLITLSGQGDTQVKVVNHETMHYVVHGGEPPQAQVELTVDDDGDLERNRTVLREIVTGSSADNDRALAVAGDVFDGESYDEYDSTTRGLMAFLSRKGLELAEEEYSGYIY